MGFSGSHRPTLYPERLSPTLPTAARRNKTCPGTFVASGLTRRGAPTDNQSMTSRSLCALTLAAAAFVFTACGQSGTTSTTTPITTIPSTSTSTAAPASAALFRAAAEKMIQAGSARMQMDSVVETQGVNVHMTMDAHVAYNNPTVMSTHLVEALPVGNLTMDERLLGPTAYVRSTAFDANPQFAHKWVKLDLSKVLGSNFPGLGGGAMSPQQATAYLQGITGTVKTVGPDTIDGTPTTHYRASIDYQRMIRHLSPKLRALMKSAAKLFPSRPIPVDLWLDHSGQLRAEHLVLKTPATSMDLRIRFSEFGVPVHVSAPPASQVFELPPSVLKAIGSGAAPAA